MDLLKSEFEIVKTYFKRFAALFVFAALLLSVPVTLTLLANQQDIRQHAAELNQSIQYIKFDPGAISISSAGKPIPMSVLAYDANNQPIYNGVTYQWGMSSTGVGTLVGVNGSIATFLPKSNGYGDIWVTASSNISPPLTMSMPVSIGGVSPTPKPTIIASPTPQITVPPTPSISPSPTVIRLFGQYAWTGTCTSGCQGDAYHTMNITSNDGTKFSGTGFYNADPTTTWNISGYTKSDNSIVFTMIYTGNNAGYTVNGSGTYIGNGEWSGKLSTSQNQTATWKVSPFKQVPVVNSAPKLESLTIDSKIITTNKTYYIKVTSSDAEGGNDVASQYALINYQGSNAGHYRGFVGWSQIGFAKYWNNSFKAGTAPVNCVANSGSKSAGQAALYSGYGSEYINLSSCTTEVYGNIRITTLGITFNSNFGAPVDNSISGFTDDMAGLFAGWNLMTTFTLGPPTPPSVSSINFSNPVSADGITPYKLEFVSIDSNGGTNISGQYALINYQGASAGQYRGFFAWSQNSFPYWNNQFKAGSSIKCSGGGAAAMYIAYGAEYANIKGCATSVSGIKRITTFSISFNKNFTSPASNSISGFTDNMNNLNSGWNEYASFSLSR